MALISVIAAIFLPMLGFFALLGLAATFYDYNKKIYGLFLFHLKYFLITKEHYDPIISCFFIFFLLVNIVSFVMRLAC